MTATLNLRPRRVDTLAPVDSNVQLAAGLWRLVLEAPELASLVQPGQFVQLGLGSQSAHFLRRPFSVLDVGSDQDGCFRRLSLLYQIVGSGTAAMTELRAGDAVNVLGPLGQGWRPPLETRRALLVGGGVGYAPLILLAADLAAHEVEVHSVIGARNSATLLALWASGLDCRPASCKDREAEIQNMTAHFATDDGSWGYHGMNVDLLPDLLDQLQFDYIATCGPEAMQKAVAAMALKRGIYCEVSLERRMACGLGCCLSCVVQTKSGNQRACLDGPVFAAQEVIW